MSTPILPTSNRAGDAQSDSNLARHTRRELALIGEEGRVVEAFAEIANIFAEVADSGGSHNALLPVLTKLLNFDNLRPLTDDPSEWEHHGAEVWGENGGIWQNYRNSAAFSRDGGKTYYLVNEVYKGVPPTYYESALSDTEEVSSNT